MAKLLQVRVDTSSSSGLVGLEFESIHPDQGWVPASKNIALQLVLEAWVGRGAGPHPRKGDFEEWQEFAYGKHRPVSQEEYETSETSKGYSEKEGYYLREEPLVFLFISAASDEVTCISTMDISDEPPVTKMTFKLKDPQLSRLFVPGMVWESAVYEMD